MSAAPATFEGRVHEHRSRCPRRPDTARRRPTHGWRHSLARGEPAFTPALPVEYGEAFAGLPLGISTDRNYRDECYSLDIGDMVISSIRVKQAARKKFGAERVEKGLGWYGAMRIIQMRFMRLPKPQVKRGEHPVY